MIWSRYVKADLFRVIISLGLGVTPTLAQSPAPSVYPIPSVYIATAELYGIADPTLLYAIAMQESGRFDKKGGALKPWPWALNVDGRGYYYRDMTEAWNALAAFLQDRPRHVGIGLVQVTWPFNADILWDPYTALEPTNNLALGARILRACYDRLGDWWQAVGCYHSPKADIASAYRERVRRHRASLIPTEERGS